MDLFCRLCAKAKQSNELNTTIGNPLVLQQLNFCCRWSALVTSNERLPRSVCDSCCTKLAQCWTFALEVEHAQKKLKTQLLNKQLPSFTNENVVVDPLNVTSGNKTISIGDLTKTGSEMKAISTGDFSNEINEAPSSSILFKNFGLKECYVYLERMRTDEFPLEANVDDMHSVDDKPAVDLERIQEVESHSNVSNGSIKTDVNNFDDDISDYDFCTDEKMKENDQPVDTALNKSVTNENNTIWIHESTSGKEHLLSEAASNSKIFNQHESYTGSQSFAASDHSFLSISIDSLDENETDVNQQWVGESNEFLLKFSQSDFNTNGTIKQEKIDELELTDWSTFGYKCWKCDAILNCLNGLMAHTNVEHPNEPIKYVCSVCTPPPEFDHRDWFSNHVINYHVPHLDYCCFKCQQFFWDKDKLAKHITSHPKKLMQCNEHDEGHGNGTPLHQKLSTVPNYRTRPTYDCRVCKKQYLTKNNLKKHEQLKGHIDTLKIYETANEDTTVNEDKPNEQPTSLSELSVPAKDEFLTRFSTNDFDLDGTIKQEKIVELELTDWSAFGYKCWKCANVLTSYDELLAHINEAHSTEPISYVCSICTPSPVYLQRQKRLFIKHVTENHTPHLKYCCYKCQMFFWNIKSMRQHVIRHPGEFKCDVCDKNLKNANGLKVHRQSHLPEHSKLLFECYLCKKPTTSKGSLQSHMRRHFHEPDLMQTCDRCGRQFKTKGELKRHMLVHNTEKLFSCDECGKTFKRLYEVKLHKITHSQNRSYGCSTCDMKFCRLNSLVRHNLIHSGELPFPCHVCDKRFRTSWALTLHRRTHNGERPYACTQCEYRCSERGNLRKHIKAKHF